MSDAFAYVQSQISNFSMEEKLLLLAYIANNVKETNIVDVKNKSFKRQAGIAKDPEFYMAPDFDEPLDDFAEYM
ncbi:MAG: DUF2281 domain-containing protein [Treponema sp.]|nr:DUF2281 domain-containing protein [Treponema sp.]